MLMQLQSTSIVPSSFGLTQLQPLVLGRSVEVPRVVFARQRQSTSAGPRSECG